jgi:hypothetical protein
LKTKITKYLADEGYKSFTLADAREQAEAFINGEDVRQTMKDNERYLVACTSEDVRDDFRVSALYKQTTAVKDEWEQLQAGGLSPEELQSWYGVHKEWFIVRKLIDKMRRECNQLKKRLGTIGADDEKILEQIRQLRATTMERVDKLRKKTGGAGN